MKYRSNVHINVHLWDFKKYNQNNPLHVSEVMSKNRRRSFIGKNYKINNRKYSSLQLKIPSTEYIWRFDSEHQNEIEMLLSWLLNLTQWKFNHSVTKYFHIFHRSVTLIRSVIVSYSQSKCFPEASHQENKEFHSGLLHDSVSQSSNTNNPENQCDLKTHNYDCLRFLSKTSHSIPTEAQ